MGAPRKQPLATGSVYVRTQKVRLSVTWTAWLWKKPKEQSKDSHTEGVASRPVLLYVKFSRFDSPDRMVFLMGTQLSRKCKDNTSLWKSIKKAPPWRSFHSAWGANLFDKFEADAVVVVAVCELGDGADLTGAFTELGG